MKEGFTVFRDQEFTSDLRSRAVKRIDDVRMLRARQFPEDAGAFAHPVRPERYREINNFYTATVYEKGAEVVRMLHTLLGEATFRAGCDLYFARHDGQAASVYAFLNAMREVSGRDLLQFERWYAQSGTPTLRIRDHYDAPSQTYTLTLQQHTPATPDQAEKQPLHVPLAYALYDTRDQPLQVTPRGDVLHDRDCWSCVPKNMLCASKALRSARWRAFCRVCPPRPGWTSITALPSLDG